MKPTKYQEREDALISEIDTFVFAEVMKLPPHVLVLFHIILCWDSICFKQSQLLVKILPLIHLTRIHGGPSPKYLEITYHSGKTHIAGKWLPGLSLSMYFPIENGDIFQPSLCYQGGWVTCNQWKFPIISSPRKPSRFWCSWHQQLGWQNTWKTL